MNARFLLGVGFLALGGCGGVADSPAQAQKDNPPSTEVKLGPNASLGGKRLLPADNPWNQDIYQQAVDPNSARILKRIGLNKPLHPDFGTVWQGAPNGIPYVVVDGKQAKVPVSFRYADESDPGPYPVPPDAPIEGGPKSKGDRHVIVLDRDNWMLYELFAAYPQGNGWTAGSGAIFNLKSNALRPQGWTSADAAGLPVLPGLVRYDEVMEHKVINHALRVTVDRSRKAYIAPATHYASTDTDEDLPPMGMRVRLRADFDMTGYPAEVQVILKALRKYGMLVADNGPAWFISGAPDPRWSDANLHTIKKITSKDLEVVRMGPLVTR